MAFKFNTPKNALNLTSGELQNISAIKLADLAEEYRVNGNYTVSVPEGFDGIGNVAVTVNVPTTLNNQTKSQVISTNGTFSIKPDAAYSGLDEAKVTVNVLPKLQEKSTTLLNAVITPDADKDGLSKVTVAVPVEQRSATITANGSYEYTPSASARAIEKMAVTVDVQPKVEERRFTANGTYTPTVGKDGISKVIVDVDDAPELEEKTITENGVYEPSEGKDGFSKVVVDVEGSDNAYIMSYLFSTENNGDAIIVPPHVPGYEHTYIDKVIVRTNVPGMNAPAKMIQVNGTYNVPAGYSGWGKIVVDVDDSQYLAQEKTLNIDKIGNYSVLPTAGEANCLSQVFVNVDIPKATISELKPNGEVISVTDVPLDFMGGIYETADGRRFKIELPNNAI